MVARRSLASKGWCELQATTFLPGRMGRKLRSAPASAKPRGPMARSIWLPSNWFISSVRWP